MDAALAEIIAVGFHRQPINPNDTWMLVGGIKIAMPVVVVITCHSQHSIGNKILPRPVTLHDGFNQVLRHILVVCQQLFCVFWQAVTAVTERRIVVMRADSRIEAHAVNNRFGVQPFHLGVRVQLVEIAHAKRQIRVGKQLDRFRFRQTHDAHFYLLFERTFLQQRSKPLGFLHQLLVAQNRPDNNSARVEIVF